MSTQLLDKHDSKCFGDVFNRQLRLMGKPNLGPYDPQKHVDPYSGRDQSGLEHGAAPGSPERWHLRPSGDRLDPQTLEREGTLHGKYGRRMYPTPAGVYRGETPESIPLFHLDSADETADQLHVTLPDGTKKFKIKGERELRDNLAPEHERKSPVGDEFQVLNLNDGALWLAHRTGLGHPDAIRALRGGFDGVDAPESYGVNPRSFKKKVLEDWHAKHAKLLKPSRAIQALSDVSLAITR
jgi:hypothetical protein